MLSAMNVSAPILDVVPGARGHILQALCRSTGPASGREVARRAGVPVSTAASVLADLVQTGIVGQVPFANSYGYQLNVKHLLARAIIEMAGAHVDLTKAIREHVSGWKIQPVAGWLYGSTARGDGDRASDIDLLFVLPDGDIDRDWWEEYQVAALMDMVNELTGNRVQYLPHTIDSFLALERSRSPFTDNLHVDGIDLVDGSWRRISQARSTAAST